MNMYNSLEIKWQGSSHRRLEKAVLASAWKN